MGAGYLQRSADAHRRGSRFPVREVPCPLVDGDLEVREVGVVTLPLADVLQRGAGRLADGRDVLEQVLHLHLGRQAVVGEAGVALHLGRQAAPLVGGDHRAEEQVVARLHGLRLVPGRLHRVGRLDGLLGDRGVIGEQLHGDLDARAHAAESHVGHDHARRRVLGEPPAPLPVHPGEVVGAGQVDRGLHAVLQGRGAGRCGDLLEFRQRVVGLSLDRRVVPEVRVHPCLRRQTAELAHVALGHPVAHPVHGDLARQEDPITAPDGRRVARQRRGHTLGRLVAHAGAARDGQQVDLDERVGHEQFLDAHAGGGGAGRLDVEVACAQVRRDGDARPGVAGGELLHRGVLRGEPLVDAHHVGGDVAAGRRQSGREVVQDDLGLQLEVVVEVGVAPVAAALGANAGLEVGGELAREEHPVTGLHGRGIGHERRGLATPDVLDIGGHDYLRLVCEGRIV